MIHGFNLQHGMPYIQSNIADTVAPAAAGAGGTLLTAHTSAHTKGNWSTLLNNAPYDAHWVRASMNRASTGSPLRFMLDLGIDPANGTSFTVICPDWLLLTPGNWDGGTRYGSEDMLLFFPTYIPAGSSVGARIQSSTGSATCNIIVDLFGRRGAIGKPSILHAATLGATPASTSGTSFTMSTSGTEGTWASLGSVPFDVQWFQWGYGTSDTSLSSQKFLIDFAYGDGSNKVQFLQRLEASLDASELMPCMQQPMCPVWIPTGTTLFVRGIGQDGTDTGRSIAVVLFGY